MEGTVLAVVGTFGILGCATYGRSAGKRLAQNCFSRSALLNPGFSEEAWWPTAPTRSASRRCSLASSNLPGPTGSQRMISRRAELPLPSGGAWERHRSPGGNRQEATAPHHKLRRYPATDAEVLKGQTFAQRLEIGHSPAFRQVPADDVPMNRLCVSRSRRVRHF